VIPLVGTRRAGRIAETVAALELELSAEDLRRIEEAVPAAAVAGERYDPAHMRMFDNS
jgi:aryl-alcohol dehydrogenase-like predicted oxidoreductase